MLWFTLLLNLVSNFPLGLYCDVNLNINIMLFVEPILLCITVEAIAILMCLWSSTDKGKYLHNYFPLHTTVFEAVVFTFVNALKQYFAIFKVE